MMYIPSVHITRDSFVTDLVRKDYRTAAVFRKYGIEFCCSARFPLSVVCDNQGLDFEQLREELIHATRPFQVSTIIQWEKWDTDFLIDYIINIHHQYLYDRLPFITEQVGRFVEGHVKKFPEMQKVHELVGQLSARIMPHLKQEEEVLFPYVRQIAHAYTDSEPYAGLLVRTLRKPMQDTIDREHKMILDLVAQIRQLTKNYTPPENACISHGVSFSLLRELDDDLSLHFYLESSILYPRAIAMEGELLSR